MKYPCLVLDHDETVVQSEATIGYPCFTLTLSRLRPGQTITLEEYVQDCHTMGFVEMCRQRFGFTDPELQEEYRDWQSYVQDHVPDPFPGIQRIIEKQKEAGGLLCVVSHSSVKNISRDYQVHFGIQPDIIYGCDLPQHQQKPAPFPLIDLMEKYNLKPEEILVVDDMKLACQMAKPLHVPIAFAAWGKTEFPEIAREMQELCDFTFHSTDQLYRFLFE